MKLGMTLFCP
ncbi:hypothetical protein F383_37684 [Gossypium arboreum]|uniref:Uncharacterized protein n=1 Tax=Gossypium arboreum TaxID=29729 RepID=A0A0B0MFN4_GOSAR|nr:hypothetical protein F383_37684 [Gossypium arboreum]